MAKGKTPTCPHCSLEVTKDEVSRKHQNRTYHIQCYDLMVQSKYDKHKTDEDPMQELYAYICELFETTEITPMMKSQIDKYAREYKYTYSGMLLTLRYYYDTMEKELNAEGIGIIPYKYEEAKQFFLLKKKVKEHTDSIDKTKLYTEATVKIKIDEEDKTKYFELISIEDL